MKKTKLMLVMVLLIATLNGFAQSKANVIAVVTKADWCGVCKEHGARVMTDVLPTYNESQVQIITNDVTNNKTKMTNKSTLEAAGIYKEVSMSKETGVITLFDAHTKVRIGTISVAKSNDDIKKAFDEALLKAGK